MKSFILLIKKIRTNKIIIAIPALIGAIGIFYLTNQFGAGITPDSVAYISVARHISEGLGFINFDGYFFILQPPLYPIILATIKKILFIDPLISAGYLNAVLFGLIIFYSGLFLLKVLKSFISVIFGEIVILVSSTLITVSLNTFTEPLFILFVILFLYYLDDYMVKGTLTALVLFSFAVSLACLTRYVGIVLVLTGLLSVLIFGEKSYKDKIKDLLLFLIITLLPTGIWILRNYYLTDTFVGRRAGSSFTLLDNLLMFVNVVINWYLPQQINKFQLFLLFMFLITGFTGIYILINRRKQKTISVKPIGSSLFFIILYSGIIIISSTTTAFDKIDNRLLSPIYVPLIFVFFFLNDIILTFLSKRFDHKPVIGLYLILMAFLIKYPINRTDYYINDYIENYGWEYGSKKWKNNSVIDYLNNSECYDKGYSIFSNAPEAVYILANMETRWSLQKTMYNSPRLLIPQIIWYKEDKAILVWFNNLDRKFLFNINELKEKITMVKIAELKDGDIYGIAKK